MNNAKKCKDRFEDIMALVMGELDDAASRELQGHIAGCDECRALYELLQEEEKEVISGFEALAHNLETNKQGPVEQTGREPRHNQARTCVNVSNSHYLERVKNMIITHKRASLAVAATIMALAASFVFYVSVFSSPSAAYALEQTVQANKRVTSYHAKLTPTEDKTSESGMGEVWVQLNPNGLPLRARIDYPQTLDGAKVVIWSKGKAAVWFKDKGGYTVIPEKNALDQVLAMQKLCDPGLAFKQLQERKKAGKVKIETTEPDKTGGFLKLTVTSKDTPDKKEVYEVNPGTKLAERVTYYERREGQWKEVKLIEYLDYNKPINPKVFDLDLPEDVIKTNQIKRPPGILMGDLTKEQIAKKVAREFFEALIAKDYDKASLIYAGMPAKVMKKLFGRFDFYRVVKIGEPAAGLHPDPTAFAVPVEVEWGISSPLKKTKTDAMTIISPDAESATKAVREFYEALIREDYAAAFKIYKEINHPQKDLMAEDLKEFEKMSKQAKFLRIVKIGDPMPGDEDGTFKVLTKIEFEMKKFKQIRKFRPFIRPVHNQPDRWNICGGI